MATYGKSEAQDWAWENLRGEWSTLMTPFTPDDEFDEDALRHNIRHVISLGTRGAGCTWGMGEFWSLTREERLHVYDTFADESAGQWLIGAHVTHTSVKEMLLLADHAESTGFDLLIAAPPYFVTKTESQVVDFIRLLADATNLAIMFYNSPQFGIVMSADGLRQLCDIPNVVGVKEASFNRDLTIEAHRRLGKAAIISAPTSGSSSRVASSASSSRSCSPTPPTGASTVPARTTTSGSSTARPRATSTTPCTNSASRRSRPSPTSGGSTPSPSSAARSRHPCASIGAN